jgi:hypothetical protein
MNVKSETAWIEDQASGSRSARQVAYSMAIFSTIFGFLYFLGLAGKWIVDGSLHSISSPSVRYASAVIALLWNICLLVLFAAMRRLFSGRQAVFADLASTFITLTCATSSINWFIQLTVVPGLPADAAIRALVDIHDPRSISFAAEHLGWGLFYGIGLLLSAGAFNDGSKDASIRWLMISGGALSLLHVLGILSTTHLLSDLGFIAWGVLLPVTSALLAARYKTAG